MADTTTDARDEGASLETKIDDLHALIDGISIAMMTTRRQDGRLVSRAMQVQERRPGTDLWFMTNVESHKLEELAHDPQVNLAFYRDRTREWVSVSGTATLTQDRRLVHEIYKPDWRAWLGDEGGERDGGPDDPRIALIRVQPHSVVYSKKDRPMPVVLFEVAKGMLTGDRPDVADLRTLDAAELRRGG